MVPPCKKDCPDRSPTCHGACGSYKIYAEQKRGEREIRQVESDARAARCEGVARRTGYKPQV